MRLRFRTEARDHIASIYSYISERSPSAAVQVVLRIRLAAEGLIEFPRMGRMGQIEGTHEWVVRGLPYVIVYEISQTQPEEIVILGVFHGAQDRELK